MYDVLLHVYPYDFPYALPHVPPPGDEPLYVPPLIHSHVQPHVPCVMSYAYSPHANSFQFNWEDCSRTSSLLQSSPIFTCR